MAMVKNPFNGNLNSNEVFSAIYNMIIDQHTFADNIKPGFGLLEKFKTEGSVFGDTKLFYATEILKGHNWTGDSEASNLLSLDRPTAPKCQAITIDTAKQIRLTVDEYLSKRAWSDEGAFRTIMTVFIGWIGDTKQVLDDSLINVFAGTVETGATGKSKKVVLTASPSTIDAYRLRALKIGKAVADLLISLRDYNRIYNEYGFLRNYNADDFLVVWNANYANEIDNISVPTIFHDPKVKGEFTKYILPQRYFGTVITNTNKDTYADNTPAAGKPLDKDGGYAYTPGTANANGCVRTTIECDVTVSGTAYHLLPGDELPVGTQLATSAATGKLLFGEVYIEDATVIAKVIHKEAIKFMSGFQVQTEFFNPRSLTQNHYLTYNYSKPDYLRNYPIIKLYESAS